MFLDMHMHEMTYSKDSFLALDEIVTIAKQKGWMVSALQTMITWD